MKTSIMHLMGLFLVLAFTASCGKKSEGGSSGAPLSSNPLTSVVGTAANASLVNWLNTADISSGMRAYFIRDSSLIQRNLCQVIGGNIPGMCTRPTSCLLSSNIAGNVFTELGTTDFGGNGTFDLRPLGCNLSGTFYTKANDIALREAVLGKSGRFVLTERTVKAGNIYTVYYSLYNGGPASGRAEINTSLPAALNPTLLVEGNSTTITKFLPY